MDSNHKETSSNSPVHLTISETTKQGVTNNNALQHTTKRKHKIKVFFKKVIHFIIPLKKTPTAPEIPAKDTNNIELQDTSSRFIERNDEINKDITNLPNNVQPELTIVNTTIANESASNLPRISQSDTESTKETNGVSLPPISHISSFSPSSPVQPKNVPQKTSIDSRSLLKRSEKNIHLTDFDDSNDPKDDESQQEIVDLSDNFHTEKPPSLNVDIGSSFNSEQDVILLAGSTKPTKKRSSGNFDNVVEALNKPDDGSFPEDDDDELRSEITSPRDNIATESTERLVTHVSQHFLLEPVLSEHWGRKCLVLDLDETLVHSSFRPVENPDFIVPVVLYGQEHSVYVVKRPGVDKFLLESSKYYELVVFTASLSMYADPVLDLLDKNKVVTHRLFRESCSMYNTNYVKDLSRLGRPIKQTIIIDNSPASYAFQPENAIAITTWFNDMHDTELLDLLPFLADLSIVDNVSEVLSLSHKHPEKTSKTNQASIHPTQSF
ncbi:hypothetical protein BB559_002470 [Furculomyces boomerangus]|uniref:FCP1 homology domain-containing protein n=1 Tax=Furculomyces boomerangus TaxID=61424 RepID=A0A2T9YUY6_9FUNG|nr:hypothetical protein BB559_002470 [Furculomyces boomerangus]